MNKKSLANLSIALTYRQIIAIKKYKKRLDLETYLNPLISGGSMWAQINDNLLKMRVGYLGNKRMELFTRLVKQKNFKLKRKCPAFRNDWTKRND